MKKSDFFFDLPQELIAQTPLEPRDHSRLLQLGRTSGEISHHHFYDLPDLLRAGDVLIVNDSRVLPARLYGAREDTDAVIEVVLLEQKEIDLWEVLVRPGKKAKPGHVLLFGEGMLRGEIEEVLDGGNRLIRFTHEGNFYDVIDQIGQMPLPPYIKEKLQDKERYQTVYSKEVGSAAAPTAGLHFTKELMQKLTEMGVKIGYVTLHVGLGTFRPVKVENVEEHKMHAERYFMPEETAALIREAKKTGNRVIAVGTTSCRTLESVAQKYGEFKECSGSTDIFIYPGYTFKAIDGLITNFHLPESTLIMLVSAFAGYEHVMNAYRTAVEERYRFFSFGDAMLII
ncbi:tRNA preQ1(34) S-adenosylmethionine ribosyltransferase-isomerase QueA [Zongyangia hominis]|uniref:S-adenosylmethionine:tRNA ribosyltransferase-isomerase n=1 Tax=Zongyangia hominis TaxID=2763677 RepID=A0A926E924_9FIRM|nr:tRNA preQ1(34) S-adenosylmethionine ribosyltransferase-isomerase QueA [Zongyangia hominis]MBC8569572.1 tRNA preQ1(34) S-adenosylmethionine ribosyltransferase-isomerase QueA [Zongyangia hominis]